MSLGFQFNVATEADLVNHLTKCSSDFVPCLSGRTDIREYARKIAERAVRFEAWDFELVGLIAAYLDFSAHSAFITNVSVLRSYRNRGIASSLLNRLLSHCRGDGIHRICLEVDTRNTGALAFYSGHGFLVARTEEQTMTLALTLGAG